MSKTFADAIFEAEKYSKQEPKHAALSGLVGDDLRLVQEAVNPYRVFNVKKFDLPQVYMQIDEPYDRFFELLDYLADRTLTGNAARSAITGVLSCYTERTAKALCRVLLKDLKCGATASTFKKVYPTVDFPDFELMLAAKIDEKPQATRKGQVALTPAILEKKYKLKFPVIAEAKYDGKRLLAMVENGRVEYLTRSGKTAEWCNGLFDDELAKIEAYIGQPVVVDGEVLARSFSETAKAGGSENDEAKSHCKFYAFDFMTLAEWKTRSKTKPQYQRSAQVESFVDVLQLQKIIKSKYKVCHSIKELIDFYAAVLKDGQNDDGTLNGRGEGLIIKNFNGVYEWDRSNFWFKWKPVLDFDLTIIGFYEGEKGKKNEGKLGGMTLAGFDENGREIMTDCGGFKVSGEWLKAFCLAKFRLAHPRLSKNDFEKAFEDLNKDQFFRQYVWDNQHEFLGKTAMLEAQEMSLAEDSTVYALRFPQFVSLRDDK